MSRKITRGHQGFTLIESLIAIAIVTVAISGPLWAAGRSLEAAQIAQDQLVATGLAQEAVEYVRAVRDDEYLAAYNTGANNGWANFLTDVQGCGSAQVTPGCELNLNDWARPYPSSTGQPLTACSQSGATCAAPLKLKTQGAENIYNRTKGTPTPFVRVVTVDSVGTASVQVERVVATVSWTVHGAAYQVSTSDDLTAWQ